MQLPQNYIISVIKICSFVMKMQAFLLDLQESKYAAESGGIATAFYRCRAQAIKRGSKNT
ncbi:hypothetical protein MASR2M18_14230 [Ignavibacteria bacterium]